MGIFQATLDGMQVMAVRKGDLVKIQTKFEGQKLAVVLKEYYSTYGREWLVQRLDINRQTVCSPCDVEVVSESC